MSTRKPLDRTAFMKFNPRWNDRDRAILEQDLTAFGGVTFEHVVSGWNSSVQVFDANGTHLMDVSPGTIYYKDGRTRPGSVEYAPDNPSNPDHVYHLSTRGSSGRPPTSQPDWGTTCPLCNLKHADEDCW